MVQTRTKAGVEHSSPAEQGRQGRKHFVKKPQKKDTEQDMEDVSDVEDEDVPFLMPRAEVYQGRQLRSTSKAQERGRCKKDVELSEEDQLDIEDDDMPALIPRTKTRHLRSTPITCLCFGPLRKELWPDYKMCSHCDDWENLPADTSKKVKRDSRQFVCQGYHRSSIKPTTLKPLWCPSRQYSTVANLGNTRRVPMAPVPEDSVVDSDGSDLDYEMDDMSVDSDAEECFFNELELNSDFWCDPEEEEKQETQNMETVMEERATAISELEAERRRATELEKGLGATTEEVHDLRKQIASLTARLERTANENRNLRRRARRNDFPKPEQATSLEVYLSQCLDYGMRLHPQGRRSKVSGKAIAEMAWKYKDGVAKSFLLALARVWFRGEVFNEWDLACTLDVKGAVANLTCVDLIRSLEKPKFRSRNTIFPSSSTIQRVMSIVEEVGKVLVPFTMTQEAGGEAFHFDYKKTVKFLLHAFQLDGAARERSVSFSIAMDGARLTQRLNHVTAGVKISDHAAIDPLTDQPIFAGDDSFAQSRELCFPLHMHMGSETKATYQVLLQPYFDFWGESRQTGITDEHWPFQVAVNADLSCIWKAMDKGAAAGKTNFPCHCCAVHNDRLAEPNARGCDRWCRDVPEGAEWSCYHRPMVTETVLATMEAEMAQLKEAMSATLEKVKDSKLVREDPQTELVTEVMRCNPFSIFYEIPAGDDQARESFELLLNSELVLRGVTNLPTDHDSKVEKLREHLVGEFRLRELTVEVEESQRPDTACFLLLQAVPCILHLENRVGLKHIQSLIQVGFKNADNGKLHRHLRGKNQRIRAYFDDVERIVNKSILGSEDEPGQWKVPYDASKKVLQTISFENWKTRRVISQLEELVEVSFSDTEPDATRKSSWLSLLAPYRRFMVQLRAKDDWNTEAKMSSFQKDIDTWMQEWVKVGPSVTNYMHLLAAGHITEYVGHYGNLYEHSQQGWEGLNALLKSVFFRRTQRGGGRKKSRLKPMARWIQRRMLWLIGLDKQKALGYLNSPTFEDALKLLDSGEEVEEEVHDGLLWEMVL